MKLKISAKNMSPIISHGGITKSTKGIMKMRMGSPSSVIQN